MSIAAMFAAGFVASVVGGPLDSPVPAPEPASPAPAPTPARLDAVLAELPGPSLEDLQRAAVREAGLDLRRAHSWLRRARFAAALPTLSVQYDHRLDHGWTLDREVGAPDALRSDAGSQGVIRAKATWELDRLVFNPDELRAARAALDLVEVRERVLVEVTRLYFERLRLLLEREVAPPADLDAAIGSSIRLREIEGLLAGLTGLDF